MEYLAIDLSHDWRGSSPKKMMSEDNDDQEISARSLGTFFICPTPGTERKLPRLEQAESKGQSSVCELARAGKADVHEFSSYGM